MSNVALPIPHKKRCYEDQLSDSNESDDEDGHTVCEKRPRQDHGISLAASDDDFQDLVAETKGTEVNPPAKRTASNVSTLTLMMRNGWGLKFNKIQ